MDLDQLKAHLDQLMAAETLDPEAIKATQDEIAKLEREQKQQNIVDSIELPYDYDKLANFKGLNDEIKSLLNQLKSQLAALHQQDVDSIHQSYQSQLVELNDTQQNLSTVSKENAELKSEVSDLTQKRDNAVAALQAAEADRDKTVKERDGLKEQVNELEARLDSYKKTQVAPSAGFQFTSTIKSETPDERAARLQKENLERLNARLAERGVEPLKLPDVTEQQFPAGSGDVAQPDVVHTNAGDAPSAGDHAAVPAAAPTLEERVKALEEAVFGQKEKVA